MTAEENGKKFMTKMVETETEKIMKKIDIITKEGENIRVSSGNKGANRIHELLEDIEKEMDEYKKILIHNNMYIIGEGADRSNKFMVELKMLEWVKKLFKNKELLMSVI